MKNTKEEIPDEEKIRLAKNAYMRKWRQKNRDKVQRYQDRKWIKYYDEKVMDKNRLEN